MFDDSDECATAAELGDFEFERKFLLGAMPPEAAGDPSPDLIVQAYVFADDGFAVRVRISGPVDGIDVDASPRAMAQALTEHPDSLGTLGAKGPANAGTRYEAERQIDALVAERGGESSRSETRDGGEEHQAELDDTPCADQQRDRKNDERRFARSDERQEGR